MTVKQAYDRPEALFFLLARSKTSYLPIVLLQQGAIAPLASCAKFTRLAAEGGYEYDRLIDGMLYSLLAGLTCTFRERIGSV